MSISKENIDSTYGLGVLENPPTLGEILHNNSNLSPHANNPRLGQNDSNNYQSISQSQQITMNRKRKLSMEPIETQLWKQEEDSISINIVDTQQINKRPSSTSGANNRNQIDNNVTNTVSVEIHQQPNQ